MTGGYPKTSEMTRVSDRSSHTILDKRQSQQNPHVQGVKIVGFSAKSIAKEAGMQKDDVIIEYDGTGNLTTETLPSLTAMTKPQGIHIRVVLVRNGKEYSLSMPSGPLGISAIDTAGQGSSGLRLGVKQLSDQKHDPIPVLAIIRESIVIPWHKRAILFRALLGISLFLITVRVIVRVLVWEEMAWLSPIISLLVLVPAGAVFAVTCHRLILVGDEAVPKYGLTSWSPRETRFVGWTFLCALVAWLIAATVSVPVLLLGLVIGAIFMSQTPAATGVMAAGFALITIILSGYVWARLSVLLPATAVDERPDFAWARRLTRGNGWRLFLVLGVFPAALGLGPALLLGRSIIAD